MYSAIVIAASRCGATQWLALLKKKELISGVYLFLSHETLAEITMVSGKCQGMQSSWVLSGF